MTPPSRPRQRQRGNPVICLSREHPDYPDLETGWYVAVGQGLGFVALYRAGEESRKWNGEDPVPNDPYKHLPQ